MSKRFFSQLTDDDDDDDDFRPFSARLKTPLNESSPINPNSKEDGALIIKSSTSDESMNKHSSCGGATLDPHYSLKVSGQQPALAEILDDSAENEKEDDNSSREKVQFQLISDMHIEHHQNFTAGNFIEPSAPIIALLGDIGHAFDPRFQAFIQWCSEHFELVLFVPGNHEFYSDPLHPTFTMQYFKEKMKEMFALFFNVKMLDNDCHEYRDVLFVGSTLWSNVPDYCHEEIVPQLNDYQVIYSSTGVLFSPRRSTELFQANVAFIESAVADACLRGLKPVVLTHHVPSFKKTSATIFQGKSTNHAFASRINFGDSPFKPVLWCAGHTHFNFDHTEEGYHLVSNQLGYPKKKATRFRKNFVLFV